MKVLSTFIVSIITITTVYSADDWTQMLPPDPIPEPRNSHALAYIGEDRLLLFGGESDAVWYNDTWLYDLSDNTWTNLDPTGSIPVERIFHGMAYIGNDRVFMYGGANSTENLGDFWIYDLSDNTWTQIIPSAGLPGVRYGHTMCYMGDDQVFLFGGHSGLGYLHSSWIYDSSDNTFTNVTPAGDSPPGCFHYDMARIGDGKFLQFGGYIEGGGYSDETWLYDCVTNTWSNMNPPGDIPDDRWFHAVTYLADDQVVMYGGEQYYSPMDETWVYDLSENYWSPDDNTVTPGPNSRHSMCETSLDGSSYPVMFGGWIYGNDDNETWTFGGGDYFVSVVPMMQSNLPRKFQLFSNFPNPFNPTTIIGFELPVASEVQLQIFDIHGRDMGRRSSHPFMPGYHQITFDGSDLASGIYVYQLTAGNFISSGKMVLMK